MNCKIHENILQNSREYTAKFTRIYCKIHENILQNSGEYTAQFTKIYCKFTRIYCKIHENKLQNSRECTAKYLQSQTRETEIYQRLEYAIFSTTCSNVYNLSTRPIIKHLPSEIFKNPLQIRNTKPSKIAKFHKFYVFCLKLEYFFYNILIPEWISYASSSG